MRVVVTRIEPDGAMQRRVVDTTRRDDGPRWEDLAERALASQPPYRPVPGAAVYHISVDDRLAQVASERNRFEPGLTQIPFWLPVAKVIGSALLFADPFFQLANDVTRQVEFELRILFTRACVPP